MIAALRRLILSYRWRRLNRDLATKRADAIARTDTKAKHAVEREWRARTHAALARCTATGWRGPR